MSAFSDQQRDTNRLRQRVDAGDKALDRSKREDVVVEDPRRLFLRSPNGTYWQISVTDAGAITAANMGPSPL